MMETGERIGITSRRLVHHLNELRRLDRHHFARLGPGEAKTVKACGSELDALALHYKTHVGSRRVGLDPRTCRTIEDHFNTVADAMDRLRACIERQPEGLRHLYQTYQHGHSPWSSSGEKRATDASHAIMRLWHEGRGSEWFLTEETPAGTESAPANRLGELALLADLMRRLSAIYRAQWEPGEDSEEGWPAGYDEKDALVFHLAELIKKKARPVAHTLGIATSIHTWATGDIHPDPARFQAAYQAWKQRPIEERGRKR